MAAPIPPRERMIRVTAPDGTQFVRSPTNTYLYTHATIGRHAERWYVWRFAPSETIAHKDGQAYIKIYPGAQLVVVTVEHGTLVNGFFKSDQEPPENVPL